jgi:outer membrane receptor protein involved in Fe transport
MLLAGINNVLDAAYAYHLNARDAFTEDQLMEPGRNVFATARFTF